MKLDTGDKPTVSEFQFTKLIEKGQGEYTKTTTTYGVMAATDADRVSKTRKDSRFSLNPALRAPLAIEQEERRVIEEKVRARVDTIAQDAKVQAAKEGYQAGLKQGFDEAYKKFQEDGADRLKRFDAFLAATETAKEEIFRENERYLMELVFRTAKMVALKEIAADPDYVQRIARDVLERVGVRENIKIRVSAEQLETAGRLREGLEQSLGALKNLTVEASPQVKTGGCIVETQWNSIDATLETQFAGIHDSLIGKAEEETPE